MQTIFEIIKFMYAHWFLTCIFLLLTWGRWSLFSFNIKTPTNGNKD